MALQFSIVNPYTTFLEPAAYGHIGRLRMDVIEKKAQIVLLVYRDAAARLANAVPIAILDYWAQDIPADPTRGTPAISAFTNHLADAALQSTGKTVIAACYAYLKSLSIYGGALDV